MFKTENDIMKNIQRKFTSTCIVTFTLISFFYFSNCLHGYHTQAAININRKCFASNKISCQV